MITFDNGARAVAEASFSASYGYDVRAEVFGSGGMVTAGTTDQSAMSLYDCHAAVTTRRPGETSTCSWTPTPASSSSSPTPSVRAALPSVTGEDARRALGVALACIESVKANAPVKVAP